MTPRVATLQLFLTVSCNVATTLLHVIATLQLLIKVGTRQHDREIVSCGILDKFGISPSKKGDSGKSHDHKLDSGKWQKAPEENKKQKRRRPNHEKKPRTDPRHCHDDGTRRMRRRQEHHLQ